MSDKISRDMREISRDRRDNFDFFVFMLHYDIVCTKRKKKSSIMDLFNCTQFEIPLCHHTSIQLCIDVRYVAQYLTKNYLQTVTNSKFSDRCKSKKKKQFFSCFCNTYLKKRK